MDLASLTGATIFQTRRMTARRWRSADADSIFALYSDPEGARWVGDGKPITVAECEEWLGVTARNYSQRGYGMFALDDRRNGRMIGCCGLVHPGNQLEAEIKYAFLRSHWGQGLASEIVPHMLSYALDSLTLKQVIATVAPENLASQSVLTKSGFRFVEEKDDEDGDLTRWYEWTVDKSGLLELTGQDE